MLEQTDELLNGPDACGGRTKKCLCERSEVNVVVLALTRRQETVVAERMRTNRRNNK